MCDAARQRSNDKFNGRAARNDMRANLRITDHTTVTSCDFWFGFAGESVRKEKRRQDAVRLDYSGQGARRLQTPPRSTTGGGETSVAFLLSVDPLLKSASQPSQFFDGILDGRN